MRNLAEYPITPEEIVDCLKVMSWDANMEERIGDMRPLLLSVAAEVVKAADEMLKGIDKRMKEPPPLKWVVPWDKATALIEAFESGNPKPYIEPERKPEK